MMLGSVQEEWVHERSGLSIDIYLKQLHLAVEVDGYANFLHVSCIPSVRRPQCANPRVCAYVPAPGRVFTLAHGQ